MNHKQENKIRNGKITEFHDNTVIQRWKAVEGAFARKPVATSNYCTYFKRYSNDYFSLKVS